MGTTTEPVEGSGSCPAWMARVSNPYWVCELSCGLLSVIVDTPLPCCLTVIVEVTAEGVNFGQPGVRGQGSRIRDYGSVGSRR